VGLKYAPFEVSFRQIPEARNGRSEQQTRCERNHVRRRAFHAPR